MEDGHKLVSLERHSNLQLGYADIRDVTVLQQLYIFIESLGMNIALILPRPLT